MGHSISVQVRTLHQIISITCPSTQISTDERKNADNYEPINMSVSQMNAWSVKLFAMQHGAQTNEQLAKTLLEQQMNLSR